MLSSFRRVQVSGVYSLVTRLLIHPLPTPGLLGGEELLFGTSLSTGPHTSFLWCLFVSDEPPFPHEPLRIRRVTTKGRSQEVELERRFKDVSNNVTSDDPRWGRQRLSHPDPTSDS